MNVSAPSTPGIDAWASQFVVSLRAECQRVRESVVANQARWEQAEAQLDEQIQHLAEALETRQSEAAARICELETRLAEAEQRVAGGGENGGVEGDVSDDFRRRYELALDDLRELKAKNSELQQQVARLRAANTSNIASGRSAGGVLDWEAEKTRILAVLECDCENTAERHSERLKIDDVIRATDQVIAAKDRQIDELKKQLADSSSTSSSPAVTDENTLNTLLDRDEVIREERGKLQRLQQEWSDKLRRAEIEVSLERAAIGRERAELESRYRATTSPSQPVPFGTTTQAAKPVRGRWLARLGLADTEPKDEQPTRP